MSCTNGSQKKSSAPDSINPNDIGVLCAYFGAEGALCRVLDLIPEAIKKILTFNGSQEDGLKIFEDLLKKAAKKTVTLIIDDLTGRIPLDSFCQSEPPPQPEDITYSDIFIYFAELVPILNYFFLANEILTGNSTKLLDKIVGLWLREQWFTNCECKSRQKQPNEPDYPINPPAVGRCTAPETLAYLNSIIDSCNEGNRVSALNAQQGNTDSSESVRDEAISQFISGLPSQGYFDITVEDGRADIIAPILPPQETSYGGVNSTLFVSSTNFRVDQVGFKDVFASITDFEGQVIVSRLRTFSYTVSTPFKITTNFVENCPPPIPPIPELDGRKKREIEDSDFCTLFPNDPFCITKPPELECEAEYVICAESVCGLFRKPVRKVLNVTGETVSVDVETFTDCLIPREIISVDLLECATPPPPPVNCEDNRQAVRDWTFSYASTRTVYVGFYRPIFYSEINLAISDFRNSDIYLEQCDELFINWLIEAWDDYFGVIRGCTDPNALNYNPNATKDDGSCQEAPDPVYGCTDPNAINFNTGATIDDGSCEY